MNHIVLFEPEIPQNSGNIMRTCVATNTRLHMIKPFGFNLTEKTLKRFAANHLEYLDMKIYEDFDHFFTENKGVFYFVTRYGQKSHSQYDYSTKEDIYLIFGKESTGLPKSLLINHLKSCMRIPMSDKVRSLNLSNSVAVVIYEVLRQQGYPNLYTHEPDTQKGKHYLEE